MTDLKSMTLEEITAALRAMGEPSFRGKQEIGRAACRGRG